MTEQKKKLTIFGATGSVGESVLSLVREHRDKFVIHALSANENYEKLAELAIEFQPAYVAISDENAYQKLVIKLDGHSVKILGGLESLSEIASHKVDLIVAAIVGFAGLPAVEKAVGLGQAIALANKETLVAAGHLIMPAAQQSKAKILPIDSEHNAIFQCLRHENKDDIEHILLTASGGPFRELSPADMQKVTVKQALTHPNWDMGPKVSIDSATMMNKGLELIEADWLFGPNLRQLDAVVHPQSVVHGMVGFKDGTWLAHLGIADMRVPVSYALGFPERLHWTQKSLNLLAVKSLDFSPVDELQFPCFKLAKSVLGAPPEQAIILNTANEIAVQAFLAEQISFTDIPVLVEKALARGDFGIKASCFEAIKALDFEIRQNNCLS